MKDNQIDWYGYGWAAFRCSTSIPTEYLPPLEDQELQLQWLDGFLAARIDNPDTPHYTAGVEKIIILIYAFAPSKGWKSV